MGWRTEGGIDSVGLADAGRVKSLNIKQLGNGESSGSQLILR